MTLQAYCTIVGSKIRKKIPTICTQVLQPCTWFSACTRHECSCSLYIGIWHSTAHFWEVFRDFIGHNWVSCVKSMTFSFLLLWCPVAGRTAVPWYIAMPRYSSGCPAVWPCTQLPAVCSRRHILWQVGHFSCLSEFLSLVFGRSEAYEIQVWCSRLAYHDWYLVTCSTGASL